MKHLNVKSGLVSICLVIALSFCIFAPAEAEALTQAAYVVELASQLGLGEGLTAAEAAAALESVGVVPAGGWSLGASVTPGLVTEVAGSIQAAVNAGTVTISASSASAAAAAAGGLSGQAALLGISGGTITAAAAVGTTIVIAVAEAGGSDSAATHHASTSHHN